MTRHFAVSVKARNGKAHEIEVQATNILEAADRLLVLSGQQLDINPDAMITVRSAGEAWLITQERVQQWRAEAGRC